MASESLPLPQDVAEAKRVNTRRGRTANPVLQVVNSLASLRLTVLLFVMSVLLVWFGTLAQDKDGIWEVVNGYFRSFVVWVPFNVFFPKSWFGETWESVRGGFWFVGGKTIGVALFVNLLAAHAVRFRVQTRGARLIVGLAVTALGCLLTFMIIANGNMKDGIQDTPMFSWQIIWSAMIVGVVVTWGVLLVGLFKIPAQMFLERILLLLGFATLTATLALMVYLTATGKRLDDSSLRILWQLIQGTIAGGVLLVGCILAFKKRAGMVLLHGGIGLMMLNELLVAQYANEEQLTVFEGQTVGYARDTRSLEIAVINRDDPKQDQVVVVPGDHLVPGERISNELLPFDIVVERFDKNAKLEEKPSKDVAAKFANYDGEPILVTSGYGTVYEAIPVTPIAGANPSGKMNLASVYVTFWKKGKNVKEPFETLLLSHQIYMEDIEEKVEHDGTTYFLGLRYKRNYKPYKIQLNDVSRDVYVGTMSPKAYASEFEIIDRETGNRQPGDISMNDPLRYQGETFYQSGYNVISGRELSTFQIVTNDGWMIPYVACMLVVVGMLAHFSLTLMRFMRRKDADAPMLFGGAIAFIASGPRGVELRKEALARYESELEAKKTKQANLKNDDKKKAKNSGQEAVSAVIVDEENRFGMTTRSWAVLGTVLGIGLISTLYYASKSPNRGTDFDFKGLGAIPVVNDGRALPFDSLSRNTLRGISRRETFEDADEEKQPAIKWMMDVVAQKKEARDYYIFRITDLEVQSLLKLRPRKRHVFSYNEINKRKDNLEERYAEASDVAREERTRFQAAVVELKGKLNTFEALERIYQLPPEAGEELDTSELLERIDLSMFLQANVQQIPLGVTSAQPNDEGLMTWEAYHLAATRQWLVREAKAIGATNSDELATALYSRIVPDREKFLDQRVEALLYETLIGFIQSRDPSLTGEALHQEAVNFIASMDDQMRAQVTPSLRREAEGELLEVRRRFFDSVTTLVGDSSFEEIDNPAVENWTSIIQAYKEDDPEAFNAAVEAQLAYSDGLKAQDLSNWKIGYEAFYNQFSPLFIATALYLIAGIVSVIGWIGWTRDLNRAAFWLLVFVLCIHSFALISRMLISGRPPVTNLYSSAVFIGWGAVIICLVLEMIFRIGIGNILSAFFGFVTLLIAYGLSISEDTFKVLEAVLDTQFWLATHVVCISLGYVTTFVAGGLGAVYIIFGICSRSLNAETRKMIARMLYGMVCFSIFFSFFGTVLGGLWADDSWGRFWGWDPKENGALLIVIWNALVLHARWGGLVKERGIAMLAVGGMIVTTWSWFLVNQLGIGLHSYGFNKDVLTFASVACAFFAVIIAIGFIPTQFWSSYREDPSGT